MGDGHACELRLLGLPSGRLVTRYPLPAGQYVTSAVAFDSAARRAAFALSLPAADVPYDTGHPFPSSRLVILDLRSGALTAVPGVELAPKTGAGLALAPNGWLFATLSLGDHGELLAWHIGLPAPVHLHDIPGPLTQAPPVRIVAPE